MDPKNEIKWKNPYKKLVREKQIMQIFTIIDRNHIPPKRSLRERMINYFRKSYLEIELTKYVYDKKQKLPFSFFFGVICGFIFYTYICKKRAAEFETISPGNFIHNNAWFYLRKRQIAFSFLSNLQLNSNLFVKSISVKEVDNYLDIEKVRLNYILAEQITNYRKKKDDLFDFFDIGEEELFKLI